MGDVVAIGTFDGVHIGHRRLIGEAKELAAKKGLETRVVTFREHPASLFGAAPPLIMSAEERLEALRRLCPNVTALEFDEDLASMSPEAFMDMLVERYGMGAIVAGFNFTFGKDARGNGEALMKMGAEKGFEAHILMPVTEDGEVVSSTLIRRRIAAGDIEGANALLGEPFLISGVVVKNRQIGRTIGFPTANIHDIEGRILPPHGVYATRAELDGKTYAAVTNIGFNPTVSGDRLSVETQILEHGGDDYGKKLKVAFLKRIRGEIKFASLDELTKRIREDAALAREAARS